MLVVGGDTNNGAETFPHTPPKNPENLKILKIQVQTFFNKHKIKKITVQTFFAPCRINADNYGKTEKKDV